MSKENILEHSFLVSVLDYDKNTGIFYWTGKQPGTSKSKFAGTFSSDGYIQIQIHGKIYRSHRLAWFYEYRKWPLGVIDHIDRDTLNCSISNLRDVTQDENQRNRKININNTSGFKGVSLNKNSNRYEAYIKIQGKKKYLGLFDTPEEASIAQFKAETEYLDEKSRTDR